MTMSHLTGERPRLPPTRGGILVFLLALGVAAGLIAVFTRGRSAPTPGSSSHDHGPTAGGRDTLRGVRLPAAAARRIGVTFAEVTRAPLGQSVRAVAEVTYDETKLVTVALKVDGWVERLHVNFTGQAVRRGAPLLDLYSPMLITAQQELVLARTLSREVVSGTMDARQGADRLVESARRRLRFWDVPPEAIAQVERSGEPSRLVRFRVPVSGVVLERLVQQGQQVMAGTAVLRIADLSTVWVEGEVFERDLLSVRVGHAALVDFQALPGESRSGRIAYVYPTLDRTTRTARVRVELPNPGLALKPGMYATLRLTAAVDTALTVPRSAVLVTGERALAFLKRPDGAYEPRPVVLGRTTEDRLEVLSGLKAGDSVVASGTFLVDAESNLGTIMGGMGDMPGMDIRPPRDSADSHAGTGRTQGAEPRHEDGEAR
ncbi:MAG TPA: efflux RND transporter periplasmic adaptor subunit [Gemmatimonadales bacterium]|nr:efflux RND transporter periplasmic adaptor subunit [Gemmatimonadales bacterium]